jgi:predicted ATPase with chaperone activity
VLRVARSIADLEGCETGEAQIAEALAMRWED